MVKVKVMKREWYPIIAPGSFGNVVLGETVVYEPETMVGKGISSSLMSLTNDIKRQNININFRIERVENGKAFANVIGYNMMPSSIKRLVRRNIEKVDMSFSCTTSDNKHLQVKPLLITRSSTTGSVAAKLRMITQDFVTKYIQSVSYDVFVGDIVSHKLQTSLKKELNKIYPLRVCEIRSMELVDLEKKLAARQRAKSERRNAEGKSAVKKNKKAKEVKETPKEEAKEDSVKDNTLVS